MTNLNKKQEELYSNLINHIKTYKSQIKDLNGKNIFRSSDGNNEYITQLEKAIITFNINIKKFFRDNYLYSQELLKQLDKSSQELKDLKSNKINEKTLLTRFLRIVTGTNQESEDLRSKLQIWMESFDNTTSNQSIKENIVRFITNKNITILTQNSKKKLLDWLNPLQLTGGKKIQSGGELTVLNILKIVDDVFDNLILMVQIIEIIPNNSDLKKKIKSAINTINKITQHLFTIPLTKDYIKTIDMSLEKLKDINDLYKS